MSNENARHDTFYVYGGESALGVSMGPIQSGGRQFGPQRRFFLYPFGKWIPGRRSLCSSRTLIQQRRLRRKNRTQNNDYGRLRNSDYEGHRKQRRKFPRVHRDPEWEKPTRRTLVVHVCGANECRRPDRELQLSHLQPVAVGDSPGKHFR